MPAALPEDLPEQVRRALAEDIGSGDVTAGLIPADAAAEGTVMCRERAVLCGSAWFDEVYRQIEPAIRVQWQSEDGDELGPEQILCQAAGPARGLLTGERTALNFLQTLSGTATTARRYAAAVAGTSCQILDTRKTLPGLRTAQKYAVRCGGATNHRLGLFDGILIKENHILAAGSIQAAVAAARTAGATLPVEVETETLDEVTAALQAGADIIMLDNFTLDEMRQAVALNRAHSGKRARLEASGGVSLEAVADIAATGVDFVSSGALTKHLQAADLSMRFRMARK